MPGRSKGTLVSLSLLEIIMEMRHLEVREGNDQRCTAGLPMNSTIWKWNINYISTSQIKKNSMMSSNSINYYW